MGRTRKLRVRKYTIPLLLYGWQNSYTLRPYPLIKGLNEKKQQLKILINEDSDGNIIIRLQIEWIYIADELKPRFSKEWLEINKKKSGQILSRLRSRKSTPG